MKDFKKEADLVIDQMFNPEQKANKLLKLSSDCPVGILRDEIRALAIAYSYYVKPRWSRRYDEKNPNIPLNFDSWVIFKNKQVEAFKENTRQLTIDSQIESAVSFLKKHGYSVVKNK